MSNCTLECSTKKHFHTSYICILHLSVLVFSIGPCAQTHTVKSICWLDFHMLCLCLNLSLFYSSDLIGCRLGLLYISYYSCITVISNMKVPFITDKDYLKMTDRKCINPGITFIKQPTYCSHKTKINNGEQIQKAVAQSLHC